MNKSSNRMIVLITTVFAVLISAVCANTVYVSLTGIHLRSNTDITKYESTFVESKIPAKRGTIYDGNNNVIATDVVSYTMVAILDENRPSLPNVPAYVVDPYETSKQLSEYIEISQESIYESLTKDRYQVEFKGLTLTQKESIQQLKLPGIEFVETRAREYPIGSFASHLIGFAQYDAETDTLIGKMGLEAGFNEELSGTDGSITQQVTKDGYFLSGAYIDEKEAVNGDDLYLTLDGRIQEALEASLEESMNQLNTSSAWASVMNVNTGEVLAWGSAPTFDLNVKEIVDYTNTGSQYAYEPGSTMKTFTYAAAIDSGVYVGTDIFDSSTFKMGSLNKEPYRVYDGKYSATINNASNKDWGYIDFNKGYRYSSNVAIAELLSNYVSTSTFQDYIHKFGFFEKVETDRILETSGVEQFNYAIEKIALGYGQGSSVTMLQIMQAYSAVFNGGEMVKPYFVQEIKNSETNEATYQAPEKTVVSNPIKSSTSEELIDLMYDVVNTEDGSGRFYQVDNLEVVGKTGTAQIFRNGQYDDERVIISFVGAFPYDDPQFMIYYAYECEYTNQAHVKTDPITQLIQEVAITYNLLDNNNPTVEDEQITEQLSYYAVKNYVNHSLEYVDIQTQDMNVSKIIIGSGTQVIAQFPTKDSEIVSNEKLFLLTNKSDHLMVDMTGWSRKDVVAFFSLIEQDVIIEGSGQVVEQSMPSDTLIHENDLIVIKLQ